MGYAPALAVNKQLRLDYDFEVGRISPSYLKTDIIERKNEIMNISQSLRTAFRLLLIASLSGLADCSAEDEAKPDRLAGSSIVGMNYTDKGIQWFAVDKAAGARIGPYGISADVCCAIYPREWTPDLKVTVKWERSDGREPDGKRWKLNSVEKTIPFEKYTEPGELYVTFLPNDDVRIYVYHGVVNGPAFPLGQPKKPNLEEKK